MQSNEEYASNIDPSDNILDGTYEEVIPEEEYTEPLEVDAVPAICSDCGRCAQVMRCLEPSDCINYY